MGIFLKKEVTKHSEDFNKLMELLELNDVDFESTVNELCVVEHTLKFYEKNSPDWQCEMDYYKRCRMTLLHKIEVYDITRQEIIELMDHTKEDDCKNYCLRPPTSHEVIREIIKQRVV